MTNERKQQLPPLNITRDEKQGAIEQWEALDYTDKAEVRKLQSSLWCRERQILALISDLQTAREQLNESLIFLNNCTFTDEWLERRQRLSTRNS